MGPMEGQRKEIEQSLSLAETELRIVNDDPSATGIHVAMVHGRYFTMWMAAIPELSAALAKAERERGYWEKNWNEDTTRDFVRLRHLEEENARLRDLVGQIVDAAGPPRIVGRVELDPLLIAIAADVLRGGHPSSTIGRYLAPSQVQQVREVIEYHIFRMVKFRELLHDEDEVSPAFDDAIAQAKAALSLLGGGEEVTHDVTSP